MSEIAYIKQAKSSLLLGILTEGECSRYTVSVALYEAIGSPKKGDFITPEALVEIKYCDEAYRARKKALSLLTLADNNEKTLIRKLTAAGFSRDIAEDVTREMVSFGYIRERDQLERLILSEANIKLSGPLKIIPKLAAKGYSQSDIRSVIAELSDRGDLDFFANAARLVEKRLGESPDAEEKKKLLYKSGYKIC